MTVYVDHVSRLHGNSLTALMIATDQAELHRFARIVGVSHDRHHPSSGYYELSPYQQMRAQLLGAVLISSVELACMMSLWLLGEEMEPAATVPDRRAAIARVHRAWS